MSIDPIYDISRTEVETYTEQVNRTNGIFSMFQESFHFDFTTFESIDDSELQTIAQRVNDPHLKSLLSQSMLAGTGGAKYFDHDVPGETGFKKVFLAFKKVNGKYNVVYCAAMQVREINWAKICVAMGITAVIGGAIGGVALLIPGVNIAAVPLVKGGAVIGAGAGGAGAGAAAIIQRRHISNVVMGYIGKELSDRNLFRIL